MTDARKIIYYTIKLINGEIKKVKSYGGYTVYDSDHILNFHKENGWSEIKIPSSSILWMTESCLEE